MYDIYNKSDGRSCDVWSYEPAERWTVKRQPKGKAKEAIGVQLTHEQVKRLDDKDVQKQYKRYVTYVGA